MQVMWKTGNNPTKTYKELSNFRDEFKRAFVVSGKIPFLRRRRDPLRRISIAAFEKFLMKSCKFIRLAL